MNLKQIEAFGKIANNNSFSSTAKELYLTQPTISAYITNLEEELGVQLFARTTKAVELTENGKKIYLYAREMVDLASTIQNMFKGGAEQIPDKEIVIAASTIPAHYLLPRILAEYSRRYPQARFRVVESDSAGVIADITEHKADLGFVGTAINRTHCEYIPFYDDELVVVTPNTEKYRILKGRGMPLSWLQEETFVLREDGSGTRREAMAHLRELGIEESRLKIVANFANTDAVLMSVKEGIGISVISRLAAQDKLERGDILDFKLSESGSYRSIYMVTSQIHPASDPAQKLIGLVKKLYGCAGT